MDNIMFLEGDEIYLRPLTLDDVDGNYAKWFNDGEICKYNSHHRHTMSKQQQYKFIEYISKSRNELVLAIIYKENNVHIGNISLQNINNLDRNAEIAFVTGEKAYQRRSLTRKAATLMINHAFNELNLKRIYFGTHEENIAMQRLGETLGFIKEGIKRKAIYKNGKYSDIIEYGLLKEEWNSSR